MATSWNPVKSLSRAIAPVHRSMREMRCQFWERIASQKFEQSVSVPSTQMNPRKKVSGRWGIKGEEEEQRKRKREKTGEQRRKKNARGKKEWVTKYKALTGNKLTNRACLGDRSQTDSTDEPNCQLFFVFLKSRCGDCRSTSDSQFHLHRYHCNLHQHQQQYHHHHHHHQQHHGNNRTIKTCKWIAQN